MAAKKGFFPRGVDPGRSGIGPVEIHVITDRAAKIGTIELRRPPPQMA
ncbi:MAG: hypothetical protein WBG11_02630 [Methylocella sp.]